LEDPGAAAVGPLRWLPDIPQELSDNNQWVRYLTARADLVAQLADDIRDHTRTWTHATAPQWACPLIKSHPGLVAEIAVLRAATGVSEHDTAITGPEQYPARTCAVQLLLEDRAAAVPGRPGTDRPPSA